MGAQLDHARNTAHAKHAEGLASDASNTARAADTVSLAAELTARTGDDAPSALHSPHTALVGGAIRARTTMKKLILALVAVLAIASALLAQAPQSRPGSIYDPNAGPFGLVANKTAGRAGDLLTIEISESQDLKNEESSDLKKETSLKQELASFNVKPNAFSVLPGLEGSSADALKGTANVSKKGKFTARVTAVVVDVLQNGNLVVNGRREIRIDQDTKLIEFSGIVRRWDIRADNTIPSELVAEAKVSYTGNGPMTDSSQRKGIGKWIHDAFQWVWPF